MTCGAGMYYTATRSELVKLVKTGNVHTGHRTSGGFHVDVKVLCLCSSGSKFERKSGCHCGETSVVCSR